MKEIEQKLLNNAVRLLDSIGLEYCIQLPDGEFLGQLKAEQRKIQRVTKYTHGALKKYLVPFIESLEQGKVLTVPIGEFDLDSIQSGLCNRVRDIYGSGNYTTCRGKDSVDLLLLKNEVW